MTKEKIKKIVEESYTEDACRRVANICIGIIPNEPEKWRIE